MKFHYNITTDTLYGTTDSLLLFFHEYSYVITPKNLKRFINEMPNFIDCVSIRQRTHLNLPDAPMYSFITANLTTFIICRECKSTELLDLLISNGCQFNYIHISLAIKHNRHLLPTLLELDIDIDEMTPASLWNKTHPIIILLRSINDNSIDAITFKNVFNMLSKHLTNMHVILNSEFSHNTLVGDELIKHGIISAQDAYDLFGYNAL